MGNSAIRRRAMTARSEEDDMDSGPAYIVNSLGVAVNLFLKPPRQDNITNFKNKFTPKQPLVLLTKVKPTPAPRPRIRLLNSAHEGIGHHTLRRPRGSRSAAGARAKSGSRARSSKSRSGRPQLRRSDDHRGRVRRHAQATTHRRTRICRTRSRCE